MAGLCMICKVADKAKGKQRCVECITAGWGPAEREQAADQRSVAIPGPLHLARVPAADWPPGRRWCSGCQTFVRLSDCNANASRCKTCAGRAGQNAYLARTYVIHGRPFTADDYEVLLRAQGGVCHLCGRESKAKRLAVDHDHKTNEVRGLLCPGEYGCNFAVMGNIRSQEMADKIPDYFRGGFAKSIIRS